MIAVVLSILVGFALGCCGSAVADEPVRLDGYVTDTVHALDTNHRTEVRTSTDALYDAHSERLWVVYVHDFGGLDPRTWGERTAAASGFGERDVLLSIAVGDGSYALTGELPSAVDDAELDTLLTSRVEPRLRDGRWADAAVAVSDGLSTALGDSGGAGDSGGTGILPLIVIT